LKKSYQQIIKHAVAIELRMCLNQVFSSIGTA